MLVKFDENNQNAVTAVFHILLTVLAAMKYIWR